MELSYSSYKTYLNCPRLYKKELSLEEPVSKISSYFSLYGKLIESFFKIYTNEWIKNSIEPTMSAIRDTLKVNWDRIQQEDYVEWGDTWVSSSPENIFEEVFEDVLGNMSKIHIWKNSRAEVTINIGLKNKDTLTGRIDFIYNNPNGTVEIIDGKGTKKPEKNVDVEQLYFYALLYYLRHKKLPDKIGFLFYRFRTIKYINFTMDDIISFKNKLALIRKIISNDKIFSPKVKISKHCKWCMWHLSCDAYLNKKKYTKKKYEKLEKSIINGEISELDL